MRHTTNKNNPWQSKEERLCEQNYKNIIIEIWIKRSVKQFLKSKSTFKNNIYRTVAFT